MRSRLSSEDGATKVVRRILAFRTECLFEEYDKRTRQRYATRLKVTWMAVAVYPGLRRVDLARLLSISDRHLRRWLKLLEEKGLLMLDSDQCSKANRYKIPKEIFAHDDWLHEFPVMVDD